MATATIKLNPWSHSLLGIGDRSPAVHMYVRVQSLQKQNPPSDQRLAEVSDSCGLHENVHVPICHDCFSTAYSLLYILLDWLLSEYDERFYVWNDMEIEWHQIYGT